MYSTDMQTPMHKLFMQRNYVQFGSASAHLSQHSHRGGKMITEKYFEFIATETIFQVTSVSKLMASLYSVLD